MIITTSMSSQNGSAQATWAILTTRNIYISAEETRCLDLPPKYSIPAHLTFPQDLIKYNGAQVSPLELEEIIREHPNVADVAVVGTQLDDGNELPTAFVTLKEGRSTEDSTTLPKEVMEFTASKVSPYKRLRGGVHVVDAIPKNAMGKTLYKDLRDAAVKLYKARTIIPGKL